ncbi:MAG TPA: ROK family protein [Candidatus Baltobacteraceae bacterium]|nr:ROK family protein [Candidatus Baltobacteraceae bacterium]
MRTAIGIDLGGTHATAATIREDGSVERKDEVDIDDRSFEVVVGALVQLMRRALDRADGANLAGIGVGSPGNIDPHSGDVLQSQNFLWEDVPFGKRLREAFDVPIFVANDARCATLAEFTYGAGRNTKNFALLTLGTGIGGGIILDGEMLIGNRAGAGEFGHHQIRATDGFVCGCGKRGCFEAQASATGLVRHARALEPHYRGSSLLDGDERSVSRNIVRAVQAGDPHAAAAWEAYTADLASGLANIISFVNPEVIAIGGGVSNAGDFLLDAVRDRVEQLNVTVPHGTTKLLAARLGNDAGAIGAATFAFRGDRAA